MENEKETAIKLISMEIAKTHAYSGRESPNPKIILDMAEEIYDASFKVIKGMDHISKAFKLVRSKTKFISVCEIVEAIKQSSIKDEDQERIDAAPRILRKCAELVFKCKELVFEDPAMGELCNQYGITNSLHFPSEFEMNNDQKIKDAFRLIIESGKVKKIIYGLSNRTNSEILVPSASSIRARLADLSSNDNGLPYYGKL